MSVIGILRSVWAASTQSPDRGGGTDEPSGAYWCHDCEERTPLDSLHSSKPGLSQFGRTPARDVPGDDTPACPSCGEDMAFERSGTTTGCAC